MNNLIAALANVTLLVAFLAACWFTLLTALTRTRRHDQSRHGTAPRRALVALAVFVGLGAALVTLRIGFVPEAVITLALVSLGALGALVLTRRSQALFALTLTWAVLLSLGAVWVLRINSATETSLKASAAVILAAILVVWGAASGRLARMFVRIPASFLVIGGFVLVLLPRLAMQRTNDAFISVQLPMVGSVQTGELGRLLLLLWLARSVAHYQPLLLVARRFSLTNILMILVTALPVLVGILIGAVSNDFGPALVLSGATLLVVFAAGLGVSYLAWVCGIAVVGVTSLVLTNAKVNARFAQMLTPIPEPPADVTQVGQGLALMAHGPTGLGRGLPQLVPLAESDMLLASIGHELGYLALAGVAALVVAMIAATRRLLASIGDSRLQFAVVGVVSSLALQSLMMIGAVTGVAPLTGMPVPFVAMSGSSLLTSSLAFALVLSAGRGALTPAPSQEVTRRFTVTGVIAAALTALVVLRIAFLTITPGLTLAAADGRDPYARRMERLSLPTITTSDGVVVAKTSTSGDDQPARLGNVTRQYPDASYLALLGSAVRPGLEAELARTHACTGPGGANVTDCGTIATTLQSQVQAAAWASMQGKTGAVVAVDVRTGEVLAYVSAKAGSETDPRDRVRSEAMAPGSTAKALTAAAALESGTELPRTVTASYEVPGGGVIPAAHNTPCGGSLNAAMSASCNPYFASLGAQVGGQRLAELTGGWLNNQATISGLWIADSTLVGTRPDPYATAAGAIGLGDAQVTALGMAQFTAQVARGGEPVCLSVLKGEPGTCSDQAPLKRETTTRLTEAMRAVVTSGTARNVAGLRDMQAAAKTGTADIQESGNNAAFIAFAPYSKPRVAVVVFLEPDPAGRTGLTGAKDAGPVASAVLSEALRAKP